jgi:hypothetical protein
MASRTASKDIITLKGSAAIVSEFFGTPRPAPPSDPLTSLRSRSCLIERYSLAGYAANRCADGNSGVISDDALIFVFEMGR